MRPFAALRQRAEPDLGHQLKSHPRAPWPAVEEIARRYYEEKVREFKLSESQERERARLLSRPVKPVDLERVRTIRELVEAWKGCGIQARSLAECAQVYEAMLGDPVRPTIFLGLSGALLAGGLRKVIRDMIEYGLVDVVVLTGAIAYQDFYNALGFHHYKGSPYADDARLRDLLINRIYDSYVDERGFVYADSLVAEFASRLEPREYSTREFLELLGREVKDELSILRAASRHGVPIFCPAIADSSIGISLASAYRKARQEGRPFMSLSVLRDNYEIGQIVLKSKKRGAIYIGGGVPKNYINDAAVMFTYTGGHHYAFQLVTDAPHWGGLSGSTLDEAKSWGKMDKSLTRATAYVEATVGLPLVVGYVLQGEAWKGRRRLRFVWEGEELRAIAPGEEVGQPAEDR